MVGEKGYPLEELIKAQKHCLLTDILISDRATVLFPFVLKSYYSFLKYCYAYTQILLSAKLLLQACRSLF